MTSPASHLPALLATALMLALPLASHAAPPTPPAPAG